MPFLDFPSVESGRHRSARKTRGDFFTIAHHCAAFPAPPGSAGSWSRKIDCPIRI